MANENELVKEITDKNTNTVLLPTFTPKLLTVDLMRTSFALSLRKKANPNGFSNSVSRLIAIGSL